MLASRRPGAFLSLLLALLTAAGSAWAQPLQRQGGAAFRESLDVRWVMVPVVVRGRSGYVQGLSEKKFRLFVDGRRVPIESFEAGRDAPVSMTFLQDLSGSMANAGKLEASRAVLDFFLDRTRPGDELAIATFGGHGVEVRVPMTREIHALRLDRDRWQPHGTTAIHDAVGFLPQLVAASNNLKRVAVLVTDGVDNASELPPAEARELVRRAELPVYVLGLSTGTPFAVGEDGERRFPEADLLNLLALHTGGRYATFPSHEPVAGPCNEVLEDIRHQYVLGFAASGHGIESYRRIRVEVTKRGSRVLFRRGYTGGMPAAWGES